MSIQNPRLLVLASGSATGGGSGFENMAYYFRSIRRTSRVEIAGVVSNHERGGVRQRADNLRIPFFHFRGPSTAENYQRLVEDSRADFVALSGWLKMVRGLDPKTTFNIHPGDTKKFGGKGFYGHHVHEAVLTAYRAGEITHSAVTMHFAVDNEQYDTGPIFFQKEVDILHGDTSETLGNRVNQWEHYYQPRITELVVTGQIYWDGENPESLHVPDNYTFLP